MQRNSRICWIWQPLILFNPDIIICIGYPTGNLFYLLKAEGKGQMAENAFPSAFSLLPSALLGGKKKPLCQRQRGK